MSQYVALLESGSGELFQAVLEKRVLSSVFVLRSSKGGYYQSAGTAPEGMALGASHFLIGSIAGELRKEGLEIFNLGGAPKESSLARFKSGFGATLVSSTAVSLYIGAQWRRKLTILLRLAQQNPEALSSALFGKVHCVKVFAGETSSPVTHPEVPGAEIRPMTDEDLRSLDTGDREFRSRQLERLAHFGRSYAYSVFLEGKLAHISWLLPSAVLRKEASDILRLSDEQAELTAVETLPEFRGRGIFGLAIGKLFAIARQQGIQRIYLKIDAENKASEAGVLKTNLRCIGWVVLIVPPLRIRRTWVLRLFR